MSSYAASGALTRSRSRLLVAVKPYWLHLYLLAYTPLLLLLDSRTQNLAQQSALGVLTFFVLWLCTLKLPRGQRLQVWLCVGIATIFEIFGSLIWGVYRYRWHNLPLYVPPGHGLVYLFGVTAAALPVFRHHGRRAAQVVLALCTLYAIAGLTVLPPVTHRLDVQGALCWPVLAWCILKTERYALFAAIFLATLDLELAGTLAGDWTWLPVAPWDGVPSGNPPSAIAGGYSLIDGSVGLVLAALAGLRLRAWATPLGPRPTPEPSGAGGDR
ncbi:MAG: hypothetical protein M3Y62_01020 [Candidatus Dormibacteraeota bacterium]|nr:hypothetical protein [Candidatus Dormibacteraeota bacterium]